MSLKWMGSGLTNCAATLFVASPFGLPHAAFCCLTQPLAASFNGSPWLPCFRRSLCSLVPSKLRSRATETKVAQRPLLLSRSDTIFTRRHIVGPAEGVVERLARGKARTEGDFLARCIGVARVAQQLAGKAQTIARDHGRKVLALAPFVDGLGQQARRYAKVLGHGAGIAVGVAIGPLLHQRMANRGVEFLQPLAAHSLSPREKLARTIG